VIKLRIAHIGIAVRKLDASIALFSRLLGKSPDLLEEIENQQVHTAMFKLDDSAIELLEPTSADSVIGRFVDNRGEGVHHVSLYVDDIERELLRLRQEGFQLVDEKPRRGADNCLVAFVHPKSTNGVLIELCQKSRP
jgi:methylmalonyl-CoA/ethylmalonyl-CoA epimerase